MSDETYRSEGCAAVTSQMHRRDAIVLFVRSVTQQVFVFY